MSTCFLTPLATLLSVLPMCVAAVGLRGYGATDGQTARGRDHVVTAEDRSDGIRHAFVVIAVGRSGRCRATSGRADTRDVNRAAAVRSHPTPTADDVLGKRRYGVSRDAGHVSPSCRSTSKRSHRCLRTHRMFARCLATGGTLTRIRTRQFRRTRTSFGVVIDNFLGETFAPAAVIIIIIVSVNTYIIIATQSYSVAVPHTDTDKSVQSTNRTKSLPYRRPA